MRIAVKLGASYAILAVLLVGASVVGVISTRAGETAARRAQSDVAATRELKQFQLDGSGVAIGENSIGFDYNSRSDPADDLDHFAGSVAAFRRDSALVSLLPWTRSQRATLGNAQRVFDVYVEQSQQANTDFALGTLAGIRAANDLVNDLAFLGVTQGLNDLAVSFGADVDARAVDAREVAARDAFACGSLPSAGS